MGTQGCAGTISPVPAQATLVPVMLQGLGSPGWQLLSRGHCGGTAGGSTLTLLMQLQKPVWDHGKHSSAIKNKYIKLPETSRCLGKGKALTALTKPSQEEQCQDRSPSWDALARPKTLTHAELGQTKTRGAGVPLGRQTLAALAKNPPRAVSSTQVEKSSHRLKQTTP